MQILKERKNIIIVFILVFFIFVLINNNSITGSFSYNFSANYDDSFNFEDIYPVLAYDILNTDEVKIIDVRTHEEYSVNRIENSINLDFYDINVREKLSLLDRDVVYLIYCRSGNRSFQVKRIMMELGFKNVYNLKGGIVSWSNEGLPII